MNKITTLAVLLISSVATALAQSYVPCYTNEMMAKRIAENPEIVEMHRQSQELVDDASGFQSRGGVTIIPVVFHVIHANGPENIPRQRMVDQIERLNLDFRKQNADTASVEAIFQSRIADSQIEFRMATKDPQGNCTDGVVRVYSELTVDANDNVKPLSRWPNTKYLNIWVVSTIELEGDDPDFVVGGYAYYPNVVNWGPEIDGIVIRADQVSGSASTGRVLTHEVGHYLNLAHTFDDGCFGGDNVSDTPPTAEPNYGCPINRNSCSNDNPNIKDNVQNYMDYSDCGYMFTNGQASRMHTAIGNYRSSLVSSSNLAATGVNGPGELCTPIADFLPNTYQVCAGNSVTFTDYSWNGQPSQWNWTFQGGSPPSATTANPTVTYNAPGVYDVTLVATNATGSDTETKTALIYVEGDAQFTDAPFAEDFEDSGFFNTNWTVENPTGSQAWGHYTSAAYSGGASVRMNNYNSPAGDLDELISPSYDLSTAPNSTLKFKYAYVQRNADSEDRLRVLFTTNCGQSWILRWIKSGDALATSTTQNSPFIPNSQNQWAEVSMNLPSTISTAENVRVKFEFTAGGGNMLYIDDINLGGTVGFEDITAETIGLQLYPNPTEGSSTLTFELAASDKITLYATDLMGRKIQLTQAQQLAPGQHNLEISKEQLGAAGLYMLTLEGENMRVAEKLVVY